MRLLFTENRYATRIYAAAAVHLQRAGHQVHWMVQNPSFTPTLGTVHRLRFPGRADLQPPGSDPVFARLQQADRAVRHFGRQPLHYAHFMREVARVFDEAAPDVVFGESTQLHELIAIETCRRRGLPYLFPTATRYPPARLCFLREDSMEPVGGCGKDMPAEQALPLIEGVNRRSITPSYMQTAARRPLGDKVRAAGDKARIAWSWFAGERYLTPSPWRKLAVDRQHARDRQRWDALAARRPADKAAPYVLYPLQMQPESTIDVWGLPWNDQPEIVRRAAAALEALGCQLLVKPNPKPKYEIDARLCDVVERAPNAVAVPQGVPMSVLFPGAQAVLSVSGTVLIEAVFAGKPSLALGEHAMAHYPGVTALSSPDEVASGWNRARAALAQTGGQAALQLLQSLHRSSYAVELMDPFNQAERITDEFGARFAAACIDVLGQLKPDAHAMATPAAAPPAARAPA